MIVSLTHSIMNQRAHRTNTKSNSHYSLHYYVDQELSPTGVSPFPQLKADPAPAAIIREDVQANSNVGNNVGVGSGLPSPHTVDVLKELENLANVTLQQTGVFCRQDK